MIFSFSLNTWPKMLCGVLLAASVPFASARQWHQVVVTESPLRVTAGRADAMGTTLQLDLDLYRAVQPATEVTLRNFPLDRHRRVTLALEAIEVFTRDAVIVAHTAAGEMPLPRPDVVLLGGQVAGQPDSRVFLALSPTGNNGYLRIGGETFIVSSDPAGDTLIYDPATLPPGAIDLSGPLCQSDALLAPVGRLPTGAHLAQVGQAERGTRNPTPCRMVDLAIETDWEYTGWLFGGDTNASGAYVATLIGAVSEIYTRDINCGLQISYLRLWSDSGDPWSGADTIDQLYEFQGYWNANMTGVQRHLAHFLSGRGLGGGVAWGGVICYPDYDYAVSANLSGYFPYPVQHNHSQNWDLMVVAHETGHNFGAPHTHDMNPQIDNCAGGDCSVVPNGTMMSYCHLCSGGLANVRMEFHTRIINEEILPYLANGPGCDMSAQGVSISQHPTGQTVNTGDLVTLAVTASGTGPLNYQWRNEGVDIPGAVGATHLIASAIPADAGSYDVLVTNTCGSATSNAASLTVLGTPGDYDGNSLVDLDDYTFFAQCLFGSSVVPSPAQPPTVAACLGVFDANGDTDVDFEDFEAWQVGFSN